MRGTPDDAAVAQQRNDAAGTALVVRHGRIEIVVDADAAGSERAGLRQVEAARHAVGVVAHVDGDQTLLRIDRHLRLDRDAIVADARHRIVAYFVGVGPGRQLAIAAMARRSP